jgi:hypothetical protein
MRRASRGRALRRRALLATAGLLAGVVVVVAVFASDRTSSASAEGSATALALPEPVAPAFTIPTPRPLRNPRLHLRAAAVVRPVAARRAPSAGSVAGRLATSTPEGTTNIVLVLGRAREAGGRLWVRVRLPVLPNNTTGWVPRAALGGYQEVHTRLVVDRERLTATLLRNGRVVFRAGVGVGRPAWPTPAGEFYVRNKLTDFDDAIYGPVAFGTSARSAVLTDWPAGGFVGIHGTNEPELLPGRVSHGCIRMRNEDILELARLMPVGTQLTIR